RGQSNAGEAQEHGMSIKGWEHSLEARRRRQTSKCTARLVSHGLRSGFFYSLVSQAGRLAEERRAIHATAVTVHIGRPRRGVDCAESLLRGLEQDDRLSRWAGVSGCPKRGRQRRVLRASSSGIASSAGRPFALVVQRRAVRRRGQLSEQPQGWPMEGMRSLWPLP